jgi:SAM-dependent methyltransferase
MEPRKRFDEDARNYDKYRPTYPAEVFQRIRSYANPGPDSDLLEIGSGTGQATQPFLDLGCRVVALEPGPNLATYLTAKFPAHDNLEVQSVDFENYETSRLFDLIFSATAFHWIPEDAGLKKVRATLKPGGAVALFWNHPHVNRAGNDDPVHAGIREVYLRFRPGEAKNDATEFTESDCDQYQALLDKHGFIDLDVSLYRRTRVMSARDYIGLLNTYSDHRSLQPATKKNLEQGVANAIDSNGGSIRIYDTIDLHLARKR